MEHPLARLNLIILTSGPASKADNSARNPKKGFARHFVREGRKPVMHVSMDKHLCQVVPHPHQLNYSTTMMLTAERQTIMAKKSLNITDLPSEVLETIACFVLAEIDSVDDSSPKNDKFVALISAQYP